MVKEQYESSQFHIASQDDPSSNPGHGPSPTYFDERALHRDAPEGVRKQATFPKISFAKTLTAPTTFVIVLSKNTAGFGHTITKSRRPLETFPRGHRCRTSQYKLFCTSFPFVWNWRLIKPSHRTQSLTLSRHVFEWYPEFRPNSAIQIPVIIRTYNQKIHKLMFVEALT